LDIKRLCEGIRLDDGAIAIIERYQMDEAAYFGWKRHFENDRDDFFKQAKQAAAYRQKLLYFFVRLAVDAYEAYRIRGIAEGVYFDTFSDIRIWSVNCRRDYGEYGIEEYNWLQEHVQLRLFRLGRLQFQPCALDRDLAVGGKKLQRNQVVLNVHIPEGEPLDSVESALSFQRATSFFRGIPPVFVCHSWLLCPQLSDILKPDANIMQFQKHFVIYDIDPEAREAEQRIFNKLSDDPAAYEAHTSLQRNAKAYLMNGGKLGRGSGIKV